MTTVHQQIDRALERRALVFGSLPPTGRDLDLLARPPEEAAIASALAELGFLRRGRQWARFEECSAFGVEVVPADDWSLPPEELEAVFEEARPIEGSAQLVRPAPHHALLVLARRLGWAGGRLDEKLEGRLRQLLEEDGNAWTVARERAPGWGAERSLRLLEAHAGGRRAPVDSFALGLRRLRPRRQRARVVALSGLDGAGKSSQAAWLCETLARLGVPAEAVWTPLGMNVTLDVIARPLKRLLGASGGVMSNPDAEPGAHRGGFITFGWSTFVLVLNLLAQRRALASCSRRARVVAFDRHALDSYVRLRFLYGNRGAGLQNRLLRWLAPRARWSYLLEIKPETAYARKTDWTLPQLRRQAELYADEAEAFGARLLDGERPPEEVCREIAVEVWQGL